MRRVKVVGLAALCGAVVGALMVGIGKWVLVGLPGFELDRELKHSWQFVAAIVGWVSFSLYWEVAGRNAAAAKSAESKGSRGFHVFMTNVALLLEIAPIRGLGRVLPMSAGIMTAGVLVEAMGLFLAIWARRRLGRNWSGEISIKVEHELIRSGPYRWMRHPIYTGLLTMYVGCALVTGLWLAVVGLAVMAFAYRRKIRLEEANLQVVFGAEYEAYRRESWALVPGVF